MSKILQGRYTSAAKAPYVLFIIGMRVNSLWRISNWLAVFFAMGGMIKNLTINKNKGLLNWKIFFYWKGIGIIQYWKSHKALDTFANDPKDLHSQARRKYYQENSKGVGVWHETYIVEDNKFESIYINMPQWGLGEAFGIIPVTEQLDSANLRLQKTEQANIDDPLLPQVIEYLNTFDFPLAALIQRKFKIGFSRAERILKQVEAKRLTSQ